MIKTLKRILALSLALLGVLSCLAGCASQGKTMMKLENVKMSVNLFELLLSRTKGTITSSYYLGATAVPDSYWDQWIDSNGTTYNDYYTDAVLDQAKNYLAAMYLFKEMNLKLPDSYVEEIEEKMDRLVEEDGEGSKANLNAILGQYGANYNVLKESYLLEAKISYLKDELFGVNGNLISDRLIEDYYQDTYARFKQVFLYTQDYVYETDTDGQDIYYKKDGSIAYDTSATAKKDEAGTLIQDKNGDQIYVTKSGKVAYDKKNGTRRAVKDENGKDVIADLEGTELKLVIDTATQIQAMVEENDFDGFDQLVADYSEDPVMETAENGYYLTESTSFHSEEVVKALFKLNVGESAMVRSEKGIHIIMRYELDEGAYKKNENSDFFISTTTGTYVFLPALKNILLTDYLEQYKDQILLDEEVFSTVDIKSVNANFYY